MIRIASLWAPVSILAHDGRILNHTGLNLIKREHVGRRADGTIAQPGQPIETGDVIDLEQIKAAG